MRTGPLLGAGRYVSQRKYSSTRLCARWSSIANYANQRPCLPRCISFRLERRGAKTSSKIKLKDLPQGALALEPVQLVPDEPKYPTVVQQARKNMRTFENCVLLTRVGSFYEVWRQYLRSFNFEGASLTSSVALF